MTERKVNRNEVDENDEHKNFAMRDYHLMKDIPQGRELEICRQRVTQIIVESKFNPVEQQQFAQSMRSGTGHQQQFAQSLGSG